MGGVVWRDPAPDILSVPNHDPYFVAPYVFLEKSVWKGGAKERRERGIGGEQSNEGREARGHSIWEILGISQKSVHNFGDPIPQLEPSVGATAGRLAPAPALQAAITDCNSPFGELPNGRRYQAARYLGIGQWSKADESNDASRLLAAAPQMRERRGRGEHLCLASPAASPCQQKQNKTPLGRHSKLFASQGDSNGEFSQLARPPRNHEFFGCRTCALLRIKGAR
ncbi:hypothetical protein BDK51DRAFT_51716 [Blyttiomyces helicus]|uniref:Uncharacterized protein n=1 Tax=Blyttiomyces helicus TaxID=388810 RepID=A0A4V1IR80_9FUNG|nr:hypothetical protein BDK51DRAFT_51716 [Blyttiomyces helicus]|eukprot:RKO89127.1 hypothetical protein BDK51DRAFT_51716 [Blyttiomyces helicus]